MLHGTEIFDIIDESDVWKIGFGGDIIFFEISFTSKRK
jgi:hypothetical protein